MLKSSLHALAAAVLLSAPARGQTEKDGVYEIIIGAGKEDSQNAPVRASLSVPKKLANIEVVTLGDGLVGQLTAPGLVTEAIPAAGEGTVRRDLHVVIPTLKAGSKLVLKVDLATNGKKPSAETGFRWISIAKEATELQYGKTGDKARPVLRYMHSPYDDSSKEARDKSYKVFHHVYDPEGKRFVTNGGHTDPPGGKLLYPHHRGLMFGFNRVTYGEGKKADTWHCPKEYVAHVDIVQSEAGPVLGRHRVLIDWVGPAKDVFAKEEREMTVYNVSGGTLIEFATRLNTISGKIKLDGDPQHAGFQFRAANEVAEKTAKQTYYLRPDGKGKLGETRNWEPKKKGPVDLPWNVLSFVLGDQRYSVAYIDHPTNPGEKRYSERPYGRFGCYFEFEVTPERPLRLNHRVWLQKGEMTLEDAEALSRQFVAPPKVTVK